MPESEAGPPPGEQLLTLTQRVELGAVVVSALGEIDIMTAPRFRAALDGALRSAAARRVVVDLTAVTFLGSAGLAVLAWTAEQARRRREPLRVVVDHNRPVIRPIQITDLDDALTLCHSLDDALAV
jgi:anti-sigma B factor antagonist